MKRISTCTCEIIIQLYLLSNYCLLMVNKVKQRLEASFIGHLAASLIPVAEVEQVPKATAAKDLNAVWEPNEQWSKYMVGVTSGSDILAAE